MIFKTVAIVLAAFVASTHAAKCPDSELLKITPIATNPNLASCTKDSGFNVLPPSGYPNDAQLNKMCTSSACRALINALRSVNPSNCDLTFLDVTVNFRAIVDGFSGNCARVVPRSRKPYPPC